MDFQSLGRTLLSNCVSYLNEWFPEGKLEGREYVCGNLSGAPGKSLKINIDTGMWADFASGEKGGDLISLYAAKYGISQGDAFKKLGNGDLPVTANGGNGSSKKPITKLDLTIPPANESPTISGAQAIYQYKGSEGETLFYIARYQEDDNKKRLTPYSWSKEKGWVNKSWPAPRPLYGLDRLAANPDKRVLIVEGEKCVDALLTLNQSIYEPISWPNGTNSYNRADWSPIHGRHVLIWPDADPPGIKAAHEIAKLLSPHCPEIKILQVPDNKNGKDVADAIAAGFNWKRILDWARPRAELYIPPKPEPDITIVLPPEREEPPHILMSEDLGPPPNEDVELIWDECHVAMKGGKNPQPIMNMDNVLRVLEGYPKFHDIIWFDEFHQRLFTLWESTKRREWTDVDNIRLTAFFQRKLGFRTISTEAVANAAIIYANNNVKNEAKDWISTLIWDEKPRIDTFFVDCLGAQNNLYTLYASKNWWISMVSRVYQPGSKVDNMVVLEGGQGKFKSTALAAVGGDWFTEAHESVISKDFLMILHGNLIVEISELDAFSKAEVSTIKKVITCQKDRFRPPYGRLAQDYPRRCLFVGTTNEAQYLRDSTGGRRFWPIKIGNIDIPRIMDTREQLFAEAVAKYKAGENWWTMPESETEEEQESRRQGDEIWEQDIAEYIKFKDFVRLKDVFQHALGFEDISKITRTNELRAGKILVMLGWRRKNHRVDGKVYKCWMPKD
jgi:predicted P-loop ATPase